MRITSTATSLVILSQTKWIQKLKMIARKCEKQAEAKRDGVINPYNYNFNIKRESNQSLMPVGKYFELVWQNQQEISK